MLTHCYLQLFCAFVSLLVRHYIHNFGFNSNFLNFPQTTDGYVLRVFTIGTTKRRPNQIRQTSYAQAGHVRLLRKLMVRTINKEVSSSDIKAFTLKLSTEVIGRSIERQSQSIYPLQNVLVRKVKVIRAPKADLNRLMELHGGIEAIEKFEADAAAAGVPVERVEETEAVEAVEESA